MGVRVAVSALALAGALTVGLFVRPHSLHARVIASSCGVERWEVKTLTDPGARLVNFHAKATAVSALRRLRPPATLRARNPGVERRTYRVRARLVEFKIEEDSDVHLVIADPRYPARSMIVEFPATACTREPGNGLYLGAFLVREPPAPPGRPPPSPR